VIALPFIAILIGAALAILLNAQPLSGWGGQYLAVACLAGLDSVFGGIRAGMEGKFRNDVFLTGFFSNIAIASFLAWFGDRIYIDLFLAVAIVFGTRTFQNLALIRRMMLTMFTDWRARRSRSGTVTSEVNG
jgi:small basic protein